MYRNRIQNISLWFKCLEFFKIIKPLKFFDLSLLSNLSNDLSQVMPLSDILQVSDSSSNLEASNSYLALDTGVGSYENALALDDENLDEDAYVVPKSESSQSENFFSYTSLIDNLVDFKARTTQETYKYDKEPINLVLINRVLILNDLMLHLNEKVFLKNYSLKLYELVNKIILRVSLKYA